MSNKKNKNKRNIKTKSGDVIVKRAGSKKRNGKKSATKGAFKSARSGRTVTGVLDCKGGRFGFVADGDGDIFIGGGDLNGARHGDTVRVAVFERGSGRGGRHKREGRVVETVEQSPMSIVATVVYNDNAYFAVPDDRHYGEKLEIVALGGASEHDKVVVALDTDGECDRARVLAVLGRFDEIGMDVKSVIASHGLRTEFPRDVLEQANAFPDEIDASDIRGRRDFRGDTVFTVDGSDSKDFDDAVSIEKTDDGYRLGVYIADVAEYVTESSPLDREALLRGTSVYLADRVIPMLPERLSNGLCSLNEGEDRLVLAVILDIDGSGKVRSYEVCEGVIRSVARMTYTGVQAILDGDAELRRRYARLVPSLELMKELTEKRAALRKQRGAIDFDLTETEIEFDEVGHVKDIRKKPRLLAHSLIEEFMILANCAVAEKFEKAKIPFVYRVHEKPPTEKLQTLNEYLDAVGIKSQCPLDPAPKQIAELLASLDKSVSGGVARVALRAMAKATYEPKNDGHFGLAEKYYCHFTSPIRRYPDLAVHRIIKAYLRGGASAAKKYADFTAAAAFKSSKAERVAQECERKTDDCKKAEYMSHRIGETFDGVISSVTDFGFFVELENSAEGLVRMSTLPPAAAFDSKRLCITCGRARYSLGNAVRIVVEKVEGDRVDFRLA
ncbi:MAG: ribonuclease R [Roseburia sp.]|nr:ribonuclease R [Roseburia sp.]